MSNTWKWEAHSNLTKDLHAANIALISVIFFHDGRIDKHTGVKQWGLGCRRAFEYTQQLKLQISWDRSAQQGVQAMVIALGVVWRVNALSVFETKADVRILHPLKTVGLLQVDTKTLDSNPLLFVIA